MLQSKASLLLVDDDAVLRQTLVASFSARGYSVRSASDGFGALSVIREEMPDIILSDLQMPGMSGFELLYIVQRRFPAIRVVAMSGAYSGEEIPQGVAAHAFHAKGSNPKALFHMIEALTGKNGESLRKIQDVTLIWVANNIHDCSGRAYVLIGCPECLRTFPELLMQEPAVHRTDCIHCGTSIRYAIVRQAEYLLSTPAGSQLGGGVCSHRDLSNSRYNLLSPSHKD